MKKPLYSALYILSLMTAGFTIHQAYAQRDPSVDPMTEISIEDNKVAANEVKSLKENNGFDFSSKRLPANFASKSSKSNTPYSLIGPIIFLIALPLALWIAISKKMQKTYVSEKLNYYPKTYQFNAFKNDSQDQNIDDDDQDFPKAS